MALGYFPEGYWVEDYWEGDFWPDYGYVEPSGGKSKKVAPFMRMIHIIWGGFCVWLR